MNENNIRHEQTSAVLRSFWNIQRRIGKWGQESLQNSDLSMPQFWILQMLRSEEMIPQKSIAERTLFPKSTLSTSVEGLVSSGLVNRIIPEENRREVQLQLTEVGKQKLQLLRQDHNGVYEKMNRVLAKMPQEAVENLINLNLHLFDLMAQEEQSTQDRGESRC